MRLGKLVLVLLALSLSSAACKADDFSFTGSFSTINDVQLFTFTVGANSNVVLRSYSYAGGTNSAGTAIAEGGFDPILALFQGTGATALQIGQNDDGACGQVPVDSVTGACFDVYLAVADLTPGTYTVSIQDYANFAIGPTLGDGFTNGALTGGTFIDFTGANRTNFWAFDVLGVESAEVPVPPDGTVPEPSSIALLGSGALGVVSLMRRRLKS
ncbi:MAG: sorting protein [Acidobacteriaceae bacterium]|nr:sorting protein [Acidobacteriaceae bacterium]